MQVVNDKNCSWINELLPRKNIKEVKSNFDCECLIIGAGYTGLSAARKLGQLYSKTPPCVARLLALPIKCAHGSEASDHQ